MQNTSLPPSDNLTPMMAQYVHLKKQYEGMLLFYQMGEFYELFFDDALIASQALDIALTKRGQHEGQDIPMCGVPIHSANSYIEKLIKKDFRIAICEQQENPADAKKRGAKSVVKRDVVRIITAGTVTEDTLLEQKTHNFLLSLYLPPQKQRGMNKENTIVGAAYIDISTGDFILENFSFDKIDSFLSKLNPAEIIVPESFLQHESLFELFQLWKKKLVPLSDKNFSYTPALNALKNVYNVNTLDSFGHFEKSQICAAGAAVDYLHITGKGNTPLLKPLQKIAEHSMMHVDAVTFKNLEVFRKLNGDYAGSLIAQIDYTLTNAGGRLLYKRLMSPLIDIEQIEKRLEVVDLYYHHESLLKNIREFLKNCPDLERAIARLSMARGGPRDLAIIKNVCESGQKIYNSHKDQGITDFLTKIENLNTHDLLIDKLSRALRQELPAFATDGYFIAPGYCETLDHIRALHQDSQNLILSLQKKYQEQSNIHNLKIKNNNVLGYFIEIKPTQKNLIEAFPEFIHRQSLASAMRFMTIELQELEQKITHAADKALQLELGIFQDLVQDILQQSVTLRKSAQIVAQIDLATALAILAQTHQYYRPTLNDTQNFYIHEGRHPIVESSLKRDKNESFIANNCELTFQKNHLWLLTGPNMAGKSTFLRQNALIILMAQMGSYVPAKNAEIGIVDKLFTRIGAGDDLARGHSTFMIEMIETASILNQATKRSFVILDELGRGTATYDGLSIAWASLEYLHHHRNCRTLFATHYHELGALTKTLPFLSSHTMTIQEWEGNIIFLHKIQPGSLNRSFGIQVAKLAGIPQNVLERAQQILKSLESKKPKNIIIDQTLPLFDIANKDKIEGAPKDSAPDISDNIKQLIEKLENINIDHLSPKQALDFLYELKALRDAS